MSLKFSDRAQSMGLNISNSQKGLYSYEDQYGSVVYRQLITDPRQETGDAHATDGISVPMIGIFTKAPTDLEYKYAGYVSNAYKFIGNDILNERIRESIRSVGMPILKENAIFWDNLCRMRNEIILQSSISVPQTGDVLPVMIVNNSYNGMRAATLSFGLAFNQAAAVSVFGFSLGEMRQVHIESATTQLSSAVGSYMQVFTDNIVDMITENFNNKITEDQMLGVLDLIEGIGKKKSEKISSLLKQLTPPTEAGAPPQAPSAWQLFLAIVRYSSLEANLNVKKLLENAAESVLVIPVRMYEVLDRLGK